MTENSNHDSAYDALIDAARQRIRADDLARAEYLAREALAHDPGRAAAYNILAAVRELAGHRAEAMDLLRAGISVEPRYAPAQRNLARLGSHPQSSDPILLGDEDV